MYDLASDGIEAFYQRRIGAKKLVRREPLVGAVDGSNTIFLISQPPVLEGSLTVYDTLAPLTPLTPDSVDYDGGVVVLDTAPEHAVVADYTAVPLYSRQVIYLALAGFQLMESLWNRNFHLSSDDASYVQANQDDAHLFIVAGESVTDPVCGNSTFSQSQQQRSLLARCIELAYLDATSHESALSDIEVRERFGGIAVNPLKRTSNILAARQEAWNELQRALQAAMEQYYGSSAVNFETVTLPSSVEYETIWHWQNNNGMLTPLGI